MSTTQQVREPRIVWPFRISPEGKRQVKEMAAWEGVTPSVWLRTAVNERLARQLKEKQKAEKEAA